MENPGTSLLGKRNMRHQHGLPDHDFFEVDTLYGSKFIETWKLDMEPSDGVFLFFHDYAIEEDVLISRAIETYRAGYTAVVIFFGGYGRSEGNVTTLGYSEAEEVEMAMEWCSFQYPGQKIYLAGRGMSSLSIFRAIEEFDLQPQNIIIENPQISVHEGVKKHIANNILINKWLASLWVGNIYGFHLDAFHQFEGKQMPWINLNAWQEEGEVSWLDVIDSATYSMN